MKTVETQNEGLKRAFMLTIPAKDIDARVEQEVKRLAPQVRMPGFRPGKVPPNLVRKMHGEALQRDALSGAVQDGVQKLLEEKKLRPAMQPEVELKDEYEPGKDAEVHVRLEALPDVKVPDVDGIKLERLIVEPDGKAIDEQIDRLVQSNKSWKDAPKKHVAATGDLVVMNFEGKVGGTPFEGGKGEDMSVEIGSGGLIPGFEDQLVGAKAGDNREVKVTFPGDYPVETLKGKDAVFEVTVTAVRVAGEGKADDAFAKTLGLDSMDKLREILGEQQSQELNGLTRTHMKRRLLDQLSERCDFEVPASMVEAEFENIMQQLRHEASHEADPKAALLEIETEADDYRSIAERRVRLGLLLSEIGAANGVQVSENEMRQLIAQAASQYQGKDRERFLQYVQQEPTAAAQLRAPLYEDKVVDFLFSKAKITERKASRAEVEADLESEEGHVHGPGCGHDVGEQPAAKKAKASKGKKTPAKAGVGESHDPIATTGKSGAKAKVTEDKSEKPKPAKPKKSEPHNEAAAEKAAKTPAAKKPAAKKADSAPVAKNAPAKKAPAKNAKSK
ncbi:MAG: trigger factor [Pseudomonadota bacterium]|nr:trigger factor [Pseudomonadota bacterium]